MRELPHFPVIDSHHHLWDPSLRDYPWLTNPVINRSFGIDDLRPLLSANGVDGTVIVQTASDMEETRGFLALAAETPEIMGVVGWIDLTDVAASRAIDELREGPGGDYLVGIRHQVHDEPDDAWITRKRVLRGLDAIARAKLVFDLLLRPQHLPYARTVCADMPHLNFVIDHMAKPDIAHDAFEPWAERINAFAGLSHVACKLSGILTEAGPDTSADHLRPYVHQVLHTFGPNRLMWGSDWPVSLTAAEYGTALQTFRDTLADTHITPDERNAIFGGTAFQWYGLGDIAHVRVDSEGWSTRRA